MDMQAISAKISSLLEEVHAEGVKEGRQLENVEGIQAMIDVLEKRREAKPRRHRSSNPPPPAPAPSANNGIGTRVEEALAQLATDHPEGIYPDMLAGSIGINVREVRSALRHMTLTGTARRMARGKYLPAMPLLNLQPAAE